MSCSIVSSSSFLVGASARTSSPVFPNVFSSLSPSSNVGKSSGSSYKKSSISYFTFFSFVLGPAIAPMEPNMLLPIGPSLSIFGTTNGFKTGPAEGGGGGGGGRKIFEITSWPPVGGRGGNNEGPLSIRSSIFGNIGGGPKPPKSIPPPPGLTLLLLLLKLLLVVAVVPLTLSSLFLISNSFPGWLASHYQSASF